MDLITLSAAKRYADVTGINVKPEHVFGDETERNDYFALHGKPPEGLFIQVGSDFQRRGGLVWVDVNAVIRGKPGPQGDAGEGVAPGGGPGQVLAKASATDFITTWVDVAAAALSQAENTIYVERGGGTEFDAWQPGQATGVGDRVMCGRFVYECIQAFTSADPIANIQPCSANPADWEGWWKVLPWGKNPEQPFKTINQGLQAIGVPPPGVPGGQGLIVGSGLYVEDITVPSRVFLIGNATALEGTVKLGYQSYVHLNRHFASADDQLMVEHISASDVAIYNCDKVRSDGRLQHGDYPFRGVKVLQNDKKDAGLISRVTQCILGEDSEFIHTLQVGAGGDPVNVATDPTKFSGDHDFGTIGNLSETESISSWVQWNSVPGYVEYDLGAGNQAQVTSYTMVAAMSFRAPRAWSVKGWDPVAGDWDVLATETLAATPNIWVSQNTQTFDIPVGNQGEYQRYRIEFTASYQEGEDARVRLNQLVLTGGGGADYAGGAMLFDVDGMRLNDGAVIASSKSADNAWRGTVKEARYAPGTSGGVGFEVTAGSVMARGQNLASDPAYDVSGGSLDIDFQGLNPGTQTGGTVNRGLPRMNLVATGAPAVGDDVNLGYSVGSRWFDVSNKKAYDCFDASAGAAVWKEIDYS